MKKFWPYRTVWRTLPIFQKIIPILKYSIWTCRHEILTLLLRRNFFPPFSVIAEAIVIFLHLPHANNPIFDWPKFLLIWHWRTADEQKNLDSYSPWNFSDSLVQAKIDDGSWKVQIRAELFACSSWKRLWSKCASFLNFISLIWRRVRSIGICRTI